MSDTSCCRSKTVVGLVLAAGLSSRMGSFKPLLSLGQGSAIENAVGLFRRSGIADVTVVVGHRADDLVPVVRRLDATPVLNPDFALGMYSSVKAGIQAIAERCDGCLLLPVDIPLVRPATIESLRRAFLAENAPVIYPVFRGRHGHPPLISRQLFAEILKSDGTGGLCAILARHAEQARTVTVYDEGIHRDMDTPKDYETLRDLARLAEVPGLAECEAMLMDLQPNPGVIAHVHTVAVVAGRLATSLVKAGIALDTDLVLAGSLLHDIAKGQPDHPASGALLVARSGYPAVSAIVASHSDLDFSQSGLDEKAIVFLADKLVQGDRIVSVEQRFQRTFDRLASDPQGLVAAKGRHATALQIIAAIETRTHETLAQILAAVSDRPTVEMKTPAKAQTIESKVLATTESVCPVCLKRIPAHRVQENDAVYLKKTCPEHGMFKTVTWRGAESYRDWGAGQPSASTPNRPATDSVRGCPYDCGLCPDHRQQSCCVLIEVTARCNLTCPVCFAEAGGTGKDPAIGEIRANLQALKISGRQVNIQLSGGEPTLRDDLPEIVAMARDMGFPFVQINTNGIRLARDESYAQRLREAGLDCVFLQFDGLTDDVYRAIRGTDLYDLKIRAIDNCAKNHLGVVLVPVLVPGVNTSQIGDIIRFAADRSPVVRTVHFQPISYFGRYPTVPQDDDRITIPEVLAAIEHQMGSVIKISDFRPGTAENPYCSFNGDFIVGADGRLTSSLAPKTSCCGGANTSDPAERARRFVAQRWAGPDAPASSEAAGADAMMKVDSLDAFLESRSRTLCISGMAFQDAWTLDLDRLRQCYIHVAAGGDRLVPLCAFNLSGTDGGTLYRQPCS
ncbi:radical SAM (seleno)protein TrsS [Telmatospirillum sp.]|uniref:radical SAM (seleno)protein TrsS n=1 Tax=Telmatospirillum sp. TaxID=2079197 RepID=UPI0028428015|nr:radical SAM (seleno)protein TrsS [Telmatospirillum sp.]MDR3439970.1 NTP transferase domain-containing protein [Telmatospirillum sp.]